MEKSKSVAVGKKASSFTKLSTTLFAPETRMPSSQYLSSTSVDSSREKHSMLCHLMNFSPCIAKAFVYPPHVTGAVSPKLSAQEQLGRKDMNKVIHRKGQPMVYTRFLFLKLVYKPLPTLLPPDGLSSRRTDCLPVSYRRCVTIHIGDIPGEANPWDLFPSGIRCCACSTGA